MTKFKIFKEKILFSGNYILSLFLHRPRPGSNNKTLNARLLARVITGCHLHVMEQPPRFFALAYRALCRRSYPFYKEVQQGRGLWRNKLMSLCRRSYPFYKEVQQGRGLWRNKIMSLCRRSYPFNKDLEKLRLS
jgi:hypothetical protein